MNRRLSATLWLDLRLQFANGFYYAAAAVVLMSGALLAWLPAATALWLLPVLLLTNININGFYFVAGLVLLERGEGSLEAQVVTPLRSWEYLASKIMTLVALSLIESLAIVVIAGVGEVDLAALSAGVLLATVMLCLFGFLLVVRYDSINEFLFPSFAWTTLLMVPMLVYLGDWRHDLIYLHPIEAPLSLLRAAFDPAAVGGRLYGVVASCLWIGLAYAAARRAFHRFVVRG